MDHRTNHVCRALVAAALVAAASCADPPETSRTVGELLSCDAVDPDYPKKRAICHCDGLDCTYLVIASQACEAGHQHHAGDRDAPGGPDDCAPETCTPPTCDSIWQAIPDFCGELPNPCDGTTISCASACGASEVCGAAGPDPSQPLTYTDLCCTPKTCEDVQQQIPGFCGVAADPCTGVPLDCSDTCSGGQTCGVTGPDPAHPNTFAGLCCTPRTCADVQQQIPGFCGIAADECTGVAIDCSAACPGGEVCNGQTGLCE